jgi:hypothetical protein
MPFGPKETFLIPEAEEMNGIADLIIVPRSPYGNITNKDALALSTCTVREPLFSMKILWSSLLYFIANPTLCLRAVYPIVRFV